MFTINLFTDPVGSLTGYGKSKLNYAGKYLTIPIVIGFCMVGNIILVL